MLLNCGVGEDSSESLGLQGDQSSQSYRKSVLNIHCKDWCWSWNSSTLATWCEVLTHLKRAWCWERLKAREGDDRGCDGWMTSLTQWTGVWVSSRSWWWTGSTGMLQSMGLQRVGHDWVTELNWTEFLANLRCRVNSFLTYHPSGGLISMTQLWWKGGVHGYFFMPVFSYPYHPSPNPVCPTNS